MSAVLIWDLPTRLFHWLFALACVIAWISGDDPRYTDLHLFAGYIALGLVLFRLLWGVVGGRYARFSQFVRGPALVSTHVRGLFKRSGKHEPGHNPAGAVAIVLMLAVVTGLGVTGLIVLGGEEGSGPLAGQFAIATGVKVHAWHDWLAWLLLTLVLLHLLGVIVESLLQRHNLARAMVTGRKQAAADEAEKENSSMTGWVLLLLVALFAASWLYPYTAASEKQPYLPFVASGLKQNPLWQESCGECHMAYHPGLLPARSWQRMLRQQRDHFGEDLFLSEDTVAALKQFASSNSAERLSREASWRTLQSLGREESPLRITATPYWKATHSDIADEVWERPSVNGKLNCAACHRDAHEGGFMNGAMHIPE